VLKIILSRAFPVWHHHDHPHQQTLCFLLQFGGLISLADHCNLSKQFPGMLRTVAFSGIASSSTLSINVEKTFEVNNTSLTQFSTALTSYVQPKLLTETKIMSLS